MTNHAELIARLHKLSPYLYDGDRADVLEAADALQAMERKPMTKDRIFASWVTIFADHEISLEAARACFVFCEAHHGIQPNVKGE